MDFTVTVPPDAQNHGDPGLICLPPLWTDYFIFFATNYVAHAATLISRPGESLWETLISTANALFIPGSGALRAFRFLVLYISPVLAGPRRAGTLEQAQRAGALCMVVNVKDFKSVLFSEGALGFFFGGDVEQVPPSRKIHGVCNLPPPLRGTSRYLLIEVPPNMPLRDYEARATSRASDTESDASMSESALMQMHIAKNRNIPKIMISILQIVWGIITLYKSRSDQIALYGFGAFGLTVAPYAIMSIINLATNLLRPEYATMYLVHSVDMDAASDQGGEFRGIVASVDKSALDSGRFITRILAPQVFFALNILGYLIISILPIALVGSFTHFQSGQNVEIPAGWVLGWLIVGSVSSLWVRLSASFWRYPELEALLVIPLWIPAIGGFYVVTLMLKDFGICTAFD